jgi:hypothetical protein
MMEHPGVSSENNLLECPRNAFDDRAAMLSLGDFHEEARNRKGGLSSPSGLSRIPASKSCCGAAAPRIISMPLAGASILQSHNPRG